MRKTMRRLASFGVVVALGSLVAGCAAAGSATSAAGTGGATGKGGASVEASAQPEDFVGGGSPGASASAEESEDDPVAQTALVGLSCGDRTDLLVAADGLALVAQFPARVGRDGDGTFAGSVTVSSTGPVVEGVATPEADVYLVREGQVVATALPKDLIGQPVRVAPGSDATFTALGTLQPCAQDAAGGGMLPAGRYEVVVLVVITQDDGSMTTITGAPRPLEVT